MLMLYVAILW